MRSLRRWRDDCGKGGPRNKIGPRMIIHKPLFRQGLLAAPSANTEKREDMKSDYIEQMGLQYHYISPRM